MTNKEAIIKMQAYFMKQDPETVSRLCANMIIDLNRWSTKKTLSKVAKLNLVYRTKSNLGQVYLFLMDQVDSLERLYLHTENVEAED